MFHYKNLLPILMLTVCSGLATAALERIEEAYELSLDQVQLPTYSNGQIVIRECDGCESITLPVTEQTAYRLGHDSPAMSLKEFSAAAYQSHNAALYVYYSTADRVVTRIVLSAAH